MLNFYYPGKLAAPCQVYKTGANSQNLKRSNMKIKNTKHKQHFHRQSEPCSFAHLSVQLYNLHTGENYLPFFCHHDIFS